MNRKRQEKIWLAVIITAAVIIRLLYLQQFSSSPLFRHPAGPDVSAYDSWAKSILAGHLLWSEPQIHAPLYPFYLALLYRLCQMNYYWVRLLQSLLGFAALLPLFFLLKKNPVMRCSAWSLLLLGAIYPPLIFYQSEFISEALLIPLISLTIYAFYRADHCLDNSEMATDHKALFRFALSGILTGMVIICHPLATLGGAMLFICSLFITVTGWKNKSAPARQSIIQYQLIRIVAILIIVLPVMFYNAGLPGGSFAVQHNGGANFFLGNNAAATGGCYLRPGKDFDQFKYNGKTMAHKHGITKDNYFLRKSWQFISEHPGSWLKLLLSKAIYVWNCHAMISSGDLWPIRYYTPLQRYSKWSSAILLVLALSGLMLIIRKSAAGGAMRYLLALGLGYWIALTLTVVSSRYRMPLFPVAASLAGYGSCQLFSHLRQWRDWRTFSISLTILLLATAMVTLPHPPANPVKEEAEANAMLGEVYLLQGETPQAAKCFNLTRQLGYQLDRAYTGLGGVYSRQGKLPEAKDYFLKALKKNPYSCIPCVNLGIVAMRQGEHLQAEHYFSFAKQHWPRQPFMLYNYAIYQFKLQHPAQAAEVLQDYLTIKPYDTKAIYMLGITRLLQKRYRKAGQCFKRVLYYNSTHAMATFNLAGVEIEQHNYRSAYRYINRFLQLRPKSVRGRRVKRYIKQHLTGSSNGQ